MTVSISNAEAQLVRTVNYLFELRETHTAAVTTDSDAVYDNFSGEREAPALTLRDNARNRLVQAWNDGVSALQAAVVDLARAAGYTGTTYTVAAANYVIDYYTDKGQFTGGSVSKYVTARGITRGTLNSPTNATLIRVPYTSVGQESQLGAANVIRANVTSVATAASIAVEIISQTAPPLDILAEGGSAEAIEVSVITENSQDVMSTPNLVSGSADAATITSVGSWTLSGAWAVDVGKVWRGLTKSIETAENGAYLTQLIPALTPGVPYIPYAIVNPTGFTGSLRFDWGSKNQPTISCGSNDQWNIILPDMDGDLFPEQFDANAAALKVTVARSGGSLVIARVGLLALTDFAFGSFWGAISGSTTPIIGAASSITDTVTTGYPAGKIAHIMALALGVSMPVSGSNAVSDPA